MLSKSLFVTASAGSGKTYRLTQAVRDQICATSALVVAVTFTRAAAAEMKKRILDAITESLDAVPAEKLRLLMRADKVCFSTIDAFFHQLLADEEISPRIADPQDAKLIENTVEERFFAYPAVLAELDRALIAARLLNLPPEQFLRQLREAPADLIGWNCPETRIDEWRKHQALLAAKYGQLQETVRTLEPETAGNLNKQVVRPLLDQLDKVDVGRALFLKDDLQEVRIATADRQTKAYTQLTRLYPDMRRILSEHLLNTARLRSALLKHFYNQYTGLLEEEKRKRALRYFADVTHELLDLDGPKAAERPLLMNRLYERGYDRTTHLLCDEFQDTSGEQMALLRPLMDEMLGSVGHGGMGERSLFIVGDWKQSIYRWRGAAPGDLLAWLNPLLNAQQLLQESLPYNWRSTPLLIGFFNEFTAELFAGSKSAEDRQTPPPANKRKYSGFSSVAAITVACSGNEEPLYQRLVDEIRGLQQKTGCAWGDIAVLCRTNGHLDTVAKALSGQGIGTSGVKGRELLSLREGVALYLALTALYTEHDGKFIPESLQKLGYAADFLNDMEKIRTATAALPEQRRFAAVTMVLRELARYFPPFLIEAVWSDAESYFERPGAGQAADWLRNICKLSALVTVPEGEHSDRVKLATMHGAKGLEFPHVFVPWKEERERGGALLHPEDGTPLYLNTKELAFLDTVPESGIRADGVTDTKDQKPSDTANLLYVASTRAINSLTWILKANKDSHLKGYGEKIYRAVQKPIADTEAIEYGWGHDYGTPSRKTATDSVRSLERLFLTGPVAQSDPDDIDPALLSAEIEAGIERGLRIHSALAGLTPDRKLPDILELPSADRKCLDKFLGNPEVAAILFRRGKTLCEQHISDKKYLGIVDRLIIDAERITLIDYKTGPRRSALLDKYRAQMARYRDILQGLFGDKRAIEIYLLFVDDPTAVVAKFSV